MLVQSTSEADIARRLGMGGKQLYFYLFAFGFEHKFSDRSDND